MCDRALDLGSKTHNIQIRTLGIPPHPIVETNTQLSYARFSLFAYLRNPQRLLLAEAPDSKSRMIVEGSILKLDIKRLLVTVGNR